MRDQIRQMILSILDDDNGINSVAFLRMRDMLKDNDQEFWREVYRRLDQQDNRYFLPIGAAKQIQLQLDNKFEG